MAGGMGCSSDHEEIGGHRRAVLLGILRGSEEEEEGLGRPPMIEIGVARRVDFRTCDSAQSELEVIRFSPREA